MAKAIRLTIAVAADKLADVIDAITAAGATATIGATVDTTDDLAAMVPDDEPAARGARKRTASASTANGATGTRGGRPKLYVVRNGVSQKQVRDALAKVGDGTLSALMLSAIVKAGKNGIDKSHLRKLAEQKRLNPESVDNVVWNFTKSNGIVASVDAK